MYLNKRTLNIIPVIAAITVILIVFFNKPVKVEVGEDNITIHGVGGMNLKMDEVEDVKLKEVLPEGIDKSNTKKFGSVSVGNFKSGESQNVKIFNYSKKGPFLCITTKNNDAKYVIISYKDKKKTEDLYRLISNSVGNN